MDSVGYLLQLDNHSGKRLALQGPPSVWAAWSPAGTYAIIGSYYEADETLYSISLLPGTTRRFSFKIAKQTEEESYDLDNLTWVGSEVFRLRVTINCNPYMDDNCSDQDRQKILREYEIRANVATLASDAREISPALKLKDGEKNRANDDRVYTEKEVDIKADFAKLEGSPQFTSDCPDSVSITLRAILHKSGKVTEVTLIKSSGCSFDEESVKAIRKLKFILAKKDGRSVSQYLDVEYAAGRGNTKPKAVESAKNSNATPGLVKIKARAGDTPVIIAKRYNVSAEDVANLNGVGINTEFQTGQEISIPSLPFESSTDESAKPVQPLPQ